MSFLGIVLHAIVLGAVAASREAIEEECSTSDPSAQVAGVVLIQTRIRESKGEAASPGDAEVLGTSNLTSLAAIRADPCNSWCESDYNGGKNQGRHCSPGDMAPLCGGCSFCGSAPSPPTETCESQWGNMACAGAECYTCGDRITYLINRGSSTARTAVGNEFPVECGACVGSAPAPTPGASNCLCVFDIDRTLTGKQGDTGNCPRNRNIGLYDDGYGGGDATLSALSNEGISSTFCNDCYLGICSAGSGSGENSEWNAYILNNIMRSAKQDQHPEWKRWSYGTNVRSPWVLRQGNRVKQHSVELIRQWYGARGIPIEPSQVFFYGDRTENIQPFVSYGLNSYEISCRSRDRELYGGSGLVGYCGATPEEIVNTPGNMLCR